MDIRYNSTRGGEKGVTASSAILKGLAADGGLFVPDRFPELGLSYEALCDMSYEDTAYAVMRLFFTDFTEEELRSCISKAYGSNFDDPRIAPLRKADGKYFLELFHGRTIAFKDMALSILPHLLTTAAAKNGVSDEIVILTATSGDTGKAALAGFADVPGTSIYVYYPKDGVSPVQEKQMVTQRGENTHVIAIRGNFDDAQTGVKNLFADEALRADLLEKGYRFSSANSINIGRLIPQVVYYVYAYATLIREGAIRAGEHMNVTVPTGNFGNILAAYYARKIGIPVGKLVCASNANKVLYDFFDTGVYDRMRPFYITSSPSMDILVSSNLERLLYEASSQDTEKTASLMQSLSGNGKYRVSEDMRERMQDFYGACATEEDVAASIRRLYETEHYVIDPHTAVAAHAASVYQSETGDDAPMVIASTASPYKFGRSVLRALGGDTYEAQSDEAQFETLKELSGVPYPEAITELFTAEVRHREVADPSEMKTVLLNTI